MLSLHLKAGQDEEIHHRRETSRHCSRQHHLKIDSQILLISGPRQVGKTTVSKNAESICSQLIYLNWDNEDDRHIILQGPKAIAELAHLNTLVDTKPGIVFD